LEPWLLAKPRNCPALGRQRETLRAYTEEEYRRIIAALP
jgi:hypothetical protein